ncbi:MAG: hypothetical protein ACE37K_21445 [Planctomycetota bacterium]
MKRTVLLLVAASAAYGFSIGLSNSWVYAIRNLIKFPLLILSTSTICALCYFVLARFLGAALRFLDVQRIVLEVFRDTARLLASLGMVVAFLSLTMEPQTERDLGGFPAFLGFNVVAIALCGGLTVYRCTHALGEAVATRSQRRMLVASWLLASLLVGGQTCWLIRPFFGVSTTANWESPWFSGSAPGFRGARSFYEAVWFVLAPPDDRR